MMKHGYERLSNHARRTALYRKRSAQRKRKPKRQGSRNLSGKRLPAWMAIRRLKQNRLIKV